MRRIPVACVFVALATVTIAVANACAQTQWTRSLDNPIVPNFAGDGYAFGPSVLYDADADLYRMWFTAREYGGSWSIFNAISEDGVTWYAYVRDPVLTSGHVLFESDGVVYCTVIRDHGQYKMWYAGVLGCCGSAIGLATSDDGIHWTRDPHNPVLVPSSVGWDSLHVSYPHVIAEGDGYRMYYEGDQGGAAQVGLATSKDGISWAKEPANPVLPTGGPGSWDADMASPGGVFPYRHGYAMLFTGRVANGPQSVGLATSSDGVHWTEHPGNPVFEGGGVAAWDWTIRAGSALVRGDQVELWYSGNPLDGVQWSTGYATSKLDRTLDDAALTLQGNVPNPFHDATRVRFDLPAASQVRLEVFDVQGHRVATLADQPMNAGIHEVTFAVPNRKLPSGVYLCRLTAGSVRQTRRMFLVR